ncbi:MAG: hypothetical protein FJ102_01765 [Deltaproteobacteria bacterium]|nr:hypothetical protein [Deltaproteobacteria bacterium]
MRLDDGSAADSLGPWIAARAAVELVLDDRAEPLAGCLVSGSRAEVTVELDAPMDSLALGPEPRVTVHILDADTVLSFSSRVLQAGALHLCLEVPTTLSPARRRAHRRRPFRDPVDILFGIGTTARRRRLLDGCRDGVAVVLESDDDDVQHGSVLDPLRIRMPVGPPLFGKGVVRHVRKIAAGDDSVRRVAGVQLAGMSDIELSRLERYLRMLNRPDDAPAGSTMQTLPDACVRLGQPGRASRERTVLRASALALDIALDPADVDLQPHDHFGHAQLLVAGEAIALGRATLTELVVHRNTPVRAVLSWTQLSIPERRAINAALTTRVRTRPGGGSAGAAR